MKEYYNIKDKKYYLDLDSIIQCVEQNEGEINIGKFDVLRMWIDQFISLNDLEINEATAQSVDLSDSGKILWNTLLKYDILKEIQIENNKSFFKPKTK
jgi:hypothetical protein